MPFRRLPCAFANRQCHRPNEAPPLPLRCTALSPTPSHQSSRACLLAHVAMPCPWIHGALPCWAIAWLAAHPSHSSIEHLIPCATLNVACRPHDWPRARHSSGAHLAKPNPMALSSSRIVLAAASLHERQSEACTIGVQARA